MSPRRVLDMFCGAGGAAMGLHRAWPDAEIVGVDINPQRRYPFTFLQGDAMEFVFDDFDFVWASPPCQKYSAATRHLAKDKPRLIEPLRNNLEKSGVPYCIENTPGAPLRDPVILCGLSFGLNVKRHRLFETNFPVKPVPCVPRHPGNWLVIFGHECRDRRHGRAAGRKNKLADGRKAMDIDWMTRGELSEAIPPAYSEYIARQLP
jgi:DNA (cytosine-5)-methyltransferase 1